MKNEKNNRTKSKQSLDSVDIRTDFPHIHLPRTHTAISHGERVVWGGRKKVPDTHEIIFVWTKIICIIGNLLKREEKNNSKTNNWKSMLTKCILQIYVQQLSKVVQTWFIDTLAIVLCSGSCLHGKTIWFVVVVLVAGYCCCWWWCSFRFFPLSLALVR